ncbi:MULTISPECIES: hypothetical protein [unclassified Paenibacillus]|uniref:hypothetical protein n=1 Tax=unclassified Paenibacillus TaxID=185978 RepID=UPI0024060FA2|nr:MULTISPECIES: hypothetical protein [unclassified Paenibacillus]MDF9840939.1 hypothetical protein [Paenibacillus sp. PastF-2]MDF9847523.1 hypothetical protein [Paenibacillus sp. PastM-2]MDF9853901.1 hypothetical protein [Paenibacillus sp. PastF-1]MDH6479172.1 hypothetical protein [Paenibacillus sp. PastH-2]MDH6507091.1 hypothetical protein [Paenibacillus sp. PastM-3]
MSDFFNPGPPAANSTDPGGHKANHDVNAGKYHQEGPPGFWRQVTDLLIAVGIIAVIILIIMWIF